MELRTTTGCFENLLSADRRLQTDEAVHNRVSQKNQKSEFWFATNPTGFYRLDEPPEKISAL